MNSGEKFIADFKADISKTESIFSKFSNNKKRKGVQIQMYATSDVMDLC